MRWEVKQGDRAKPLRVQLEDEDGFPDLRGRAVWFVMENTLGVAGNVSRLLPQDAEAQYGWAQVNWVAPELDVIGVFRASFRVDPGTGNQETFPSDDYISVVVKTPP